jgi:LAGLIDADG-like domain
MPRLDSPPSLREQAGYAKAHFVIRAAGLGVPWAVLIAVTAFGNILRVVMRNVDHGRWMWLTVLLVVLAGTAAAALDWHLRRNRRTAVGRSIGPLTTQAGTIATAVFLTAGFSVPLVLAWVAGGGFAAGAWDLWLAHAPRHDLDEIFGRAAARAGLGETRLAPAPRPRVPLRERLGKPARGAGAVLTGTMALDAGEVTADDLAAHVANLEGAQGYPPGAYSLSPNPDKANHVNFTVSDPRVLDAPVPWPGPSAPGAGMGVLFRMGTRQDGGTLLYPVLPLHHMRASGGSGSGKALALDTQIPVPGGWTAMGDLRDGDIVFDEAGQPCRVTRAWPVRYERPCYEVVFSDGSVITADAEHLWQVDTAASRRSASRAAGADVKLRKTARRNPQPHKRVLPRVVTTQEMVTDVRRKDGGAQYSVRVAGPLQCPDAELLVPPYTLGAWLGDGHSRCGWITSADPEILAEIESDGLAVHLVPSTRHEGRNCAEYRVESLNSRLGVLGLRQPRQGNWAGKRIPVEYLRASEQQRRALLAGLLDTDGWCTRQGSVEFCNTSEQLARDVLHLVSSLGYKAALRSKTARLRGRDCGTAWTVAFTPAEKVFRLPRKAARQVTSVRRTAQHRYVTEIRPVPSVPVRCITVDSPSSLYLAGQACIPTHNTMSWLWNFYAEAVTRRNFAGFGFDIIKRRQFMGPLEPALHGLAVTPDECLDQLLALRRARIARIDYLARLGKTEWDEDCGLGFLDLWMEEGASLLAVLAELSKGRAGEPFTLDSYAEGAKADRSAGIRHDLSMQLGKSKELPTEIRGQMSTLCFGTADKNENRIGLSPVQQDGNCRPHLWGKRYPGKAYLDAPTMDVADATMAVRFYDWGRDASRITAYMREWPSSGRPLDDVTAEAMAAVPPLPDSYYPPLPAQAPQEQPRACARPDPRGGARDKSSVRQLFARQVREDQPSRYEMADRVHDEATALLDKWLASKKDTFVIFDIRRSGVLERIGRSRPWAYEFVKVAEAMGRAELIAEKPTKKWRILPAAGDECQEA